jgi:hypothetical protein
MPLYHLTKEDNVHKILSEGLKTNTRRTCFTGGGRKSLFRHKLQYNCQPIWTTPNIESLVKTQLTREFCKRHRIFVLELKDDVMIDFNFLSHSSIEYICKENIPAEYIASIKLLEDCIDFEEIFRND